MLQLALLRGINVGGRNKVAMADLRASFTAAGCTAVSTYITSGNVIFAAPADPALVARIERQVEADFGFPVSLLLRDHDSMRRLAAELPEHWTNDRHTKCDVLFLWDVVDEPAILDRLNLKPGVDEARYLPGAVVWRVDRRNQARTGLLRIVGTPLYRQLTIRNISTTRTLARMMAERAAAGE